jgi:hypothetical protein
MTRNELLELANAFYTGGFTEREIAFARVIAAAEREACQKLAFEMGRPHPENPEYQCACVDISDAIIKRGNT